MRYILSCVVLVSLSTSSLYSASWAKTFGGTSAEYARSICQTSDGGYIVAGYTRSFGAGGSDFLVIKLNSSGDIQWAKTFGGTSDDYAHSICQTSDGGYIVAGGTFSFGAGGSDFLVIKLNSSGDIQWAKTFGGPSHDYAAYSIYQTSDGGYIVAGYTYSFGAGQRDFLVIKLNSSDSIQWAKTFGGTSDDWVYSICQTSDSGYIVAGATSSFGAGDYDFLVIKLNSSGNIEWAKTFGRTDSDWAYSICQISDSGYIVAGYTYLFGAGERDFLVIKLNLSGDIQWAKTFGGTQYEYAYSICETSDGGYIVAGYTYLFGAGERDFLVIKLNLSGDIQWAKTFGGTQYEDAYSICQTSDGGYIVAGETTSFGAGNYDLLVIKLNLSGDIQWAKTFGGTQYEYAYSICQTSDGGYIVAGYTYSSEAGDYDFLILKIEPDGSMAQNCPWYSVNPTVTSPTLSTTSPNLTVTSPNISSSNVSPTITSPNLSIYTICEALGEYDRDTLIESPIIDVYTPYLDVIPLGNNKFYVKYGLPKTNKEFSINLSLYNLSGKLERILFSGKKSSGVYKMNLDLNDLPSGIYFLRLSFDSNYFDRKLIIQR